MTLIERRAYTLKPGHVEDFWQLQRRYSNRSNFAGQLARNVGYFHTAVGAVDQIVLLNRYDSLDDWRVRYYGSFEVPGRMDYVRAGRAIMSAQENSFFTLAPGADLNPLWNDTRNWLPGSPAFQPPKDRDDVIIVESTLDFFPGDMTSYLEAHRRYIEAAREVATAGLIGSFISLVGTQHRFVQYRWFTDHKAAMTASAFPEGTDEGRAFIESYRGRVRAYQTRHLRLSPVDWLRSLFETVVPYE